MSQATFELELEMRSLTTPLDELKVKINVFEKKKKEVLEQKQDFDILLDGEVNRLVKRGLDEDLDEFKKELTAVLSKKKESFYKENSLLPSRELNSALEEFVKDEVKNAYNNIIYPVAA